MMPSVRSATVSPVEDLSSLQSSVNDVENDIEKNKKSTKIVKKGKTEKNPKISSVGAATATGIENKVEKLEKITKQTRQPATSENKEVEEKENMPKTGTRKIKVDLEADNCQTDGVENEREIKPLARGKDSSRAGAQPLKETKSILNNGDDGVLRRRRSCSLPVVKGQTRKSKPVAEVQKQLMTDFFPIRRSSRTTATQLKKQEEEEIITIILSGKENDLKVVEIPGKGRGVVACRLFEKKEFVVEYAGELVDRVVAKSREARYSTNQKLGCYMYYFTFKGQSYCIDATAESGRLGRLLNHSRLRPNCKTRIIEVNGVPRLIIEAARVIEFGEELLYDYGDRDKDTLDAHPWLAY